MCTPSSLRCAASVPRDAGSGMLIGCALGVGVCLVLGRFTAMPVALSWEPVALGLVFALLVGTFFGIQPARKAARLSPVEALR